MPAALEPPAPKLGLVRRGRSRRGPAVRRRAARCWLRSPRARRSCRRSWRAQPASARAWCRRWPRPACSRPCRCPSRPSRSPDPGGAADPLSPAQAGGGASALRAAGRARPRRHPARGRARRRQDRGLSRGGGGGAASAAGGCWCCCPRSRSPPSWLERFDAPLRPAARRSGIRSYGSAARRRTWRLHRRGPRADVVVGARSALFLPLPDARPDRGRRGARRAASSRRTGSPTTPATWRWRAPASRTARRSWSRRRRRSRPPGACGRVARRPPARAGLGARGRCRRAMAAPRCPRSAWSTCGATGRRAAASWRRRCATALTRNARRRRAVAAVPQPPRLRAAHLVPRLRPSAAPAPTARLAGHPSPAPAAAVPPLRLRPRRARALPELRRRRRR